jgi:hypothetical protein
MTRTALGTRPALGPRTTAILATLALAVVGVGDAFAAKKPPRLQGPFAVDVTVVEDSGLVSQPGDEQERTWLFTPTCAKGACNTRVKLRVGEGFETVLLRRSGSKYRGTTTTSFTCRDRTVEIEARVTGSAVRGGVLRVTRIAGTFDATSVLKPGPGCSGGDTTAHNTVRGSLAAAKAGARLAGSFSVNLEVTGGHFPELVGDPLGQTDTETWELTPICGGKGACDVLLFITDTEDFFFPVSVYLSYRGNGLYEGQARVADPLTCGTTSVMPGYLGWVTHSLRVTETVVSPGSVKAAGFESTVSLRKDVTAAAVTAGCGPGYIESTRSYATGAIG